MSFSAEAALYSILRMRMVETQLRERGIKDERVLAAMTRVPRHEFISEPFRHQAYADHPSPIGEGQTISQPYMVAIMLQALALTPVDNVLEVGTGSGYVTALLAELTAQVISIERHTILADEARAVLVRLGHANVKVIAGDGSLGFAAFAPYDAIIVSAGAPDLPGPLLAQLAEAGRMIIPVGPTESQQLQLIQMVNGVRQTTLRELCRFVPLVPGMGLRS